MWGRLRVVSGQNKVSLGVKLGVGLKGMGWRAELGRDRGLGSAAEATGRTGECGHGIGED